MATASTTTQDPRPRDSWGTAIAVLIALLALGAALPAMGQSIEGGPKAPRWAVNISYVCLWLVLPLAIGHLFYRLGVNRTHKLRNEEDEANNKNLRNALFDAFGHGIEVDAKRSSERGS